MHDKCNPIQAIEWIVTYHVIKSISNYWNRQDFNFQLTVQSIRLMSTQVYTCLRSYKIASNNSCNTENSNT